MQTVRRLSLCCGLLILWNASGAFSAEPRRVDRLDLQDGDTIVFLGDSITHQSLFTQYVEDFFYTRLPGLRIRIHNSGVGGAKASDALQRFDRDVAAYKPKYVAVLLGMNDGGVKPYDDELFQTYRRDMNRIADRIVEIGATPIWMTPTMYDATAARASGRPVPAERTEFYNATLAYYGAWLREFAGTRGGAFVDLYGPLNELTHQARRDQADFTMIKDAVHPDAPGQLVMAAAFLEDLQFAKPLSNIRITVGSQAPVVRATGGVATEVTGTGDELSFLWEADGLPWAPPPETEAGVRLLNLGHRWTREALEVHGLDPGQYDLLIDGEPVGRFSAEQLARHVELQSNPRTPQYQQAVQVAELNRKRNDTAIRPLRNEWRDFQAARRVEAGLAFQPDNEKLKAQLATLQKSLIGIEERIAAHETLASEIDNEIRKVNRPLPRKYELTKHVPAEVSVRIREGGRPLMNALVQLHGLLGVMAEARTDGTGDCLLQTQSGSDLDPGDYWLVIKPGPRMELAAADMFSQMVTVRSGRNEFELQLETCLKSQ